MLPSGRIRSPSSACGPGARPAAEYPGAGGYLAVFGCRAAYGYRVPVVETFTDPAATPRSLSGDELRLAVNQAEPFDVINHARQDYHCYHHSVDIAKIWNDARRNWRVQASRNP